MFERDEEGASKIEQEGSKRGVGSKYRSLSDDVITECPLL